MKSEAAPRQERRVSDVRLAELCAGNFHEGVADFTPQEWNDLPLDLRDERAANERLVRERDEARSAAASHLAALATVADQRDTLRADRERLRGALTRMMESHRGLLVEYFRTPGPDRGRSADDFLYSDATWKVARAALATEPGATKEDEHGG